MNERARRAFVERLRARRVELGVPQWRVGHLLGVHRMTVYHWESGRAFPRLARARAWADLLGVRVVGGSLEELYDRPPCGTPRGYKRHRKNGDRRCPACWTAWSAYNTAAYWRRKESGARAVSRGRDAA